MIEKTEAIQIVEKFLQKNKKKFALPKYGFLKKIPYSVFLYYVKIRYRELYPDDHEYFATIIPSKDSYYLEEQVSISKIIDHGDFFLFHLQTAIDKSKRGRYWGIVHDEERCIFLDKQDGSIYRFLPNFPN